MPQYSLVSTDSAHFDPDYVPTTVAQPYPHLSKIFDHTLNDEALNLDDILASQHYSYSEILFLTAQSAASFQESNIDVKQKAKYDVNLMLKLIFCISS